ncbi:PRC-barrel domain-containing protein [Chitinasiproducens palmae]|uniref:PRC-barrel domain-containing protein n=1 Tax=Chitinasiproducens palmae TaxID=1770053 RepID=A0A1H2PIR4_9BURK|nr:PRC-barrel domain-containing protein [Chitinasiproducens palmae]SDV46164.1 PRC-barrel domain-containing protein [Chitinasiproducens palmae]
MQTTNDPLNRTTGEGATIIGKGSATADGPGPWVMAADSLQGNTVISADGDDVGSIKDIMLDVGSGRIAYAVLSSGGFLGIGDKLLAIPWQALTLDTDRKCFHVNVSSEAVRAAPGFDKDNWPTMADTQWATEVHDYYKTDPYWDRRVSDTDIDPLRTEPLPRDSITADPLSPTNRNVPGAF